LKKVDYVQKYLPHSLDFAEDLDVAFKFFDAVYDGVKTFGDEISDADKDAWVAAKGYLDRRR
jgi:Temperature dependent protein affecting M2 dsRNA replication